MYIFNKAGFVNIGPGRINVIRRSPDKGESVLCVPRQAIMPKERTAVGYSFFPIKLGVEQMNKVPGEIEISYLLVEISELTNSK